LSLPEGFKIDEIPETMELKSDFGVYRADWKASADGVRFEQTLEIHDITVPATEYSKVRQFFDKVAGNQAAPVVLLKK
jgi:hypothetical protein